MRALLSRLSQFSCIDTLRKLECQPKHLEGEADYISTSMAELKTTTFKLPQLLCYYSK